MTTATATGTLGATPLSHLLVYALDHKLNGTLVFETQHAARSAIYVQEGSPCKAKTAEPVIYLGQTLLEMGKLDSAALNRTLAKMASERRLHGEILLREGIVDPETLKHGLREQLTRQVEWMFQLPADTVYGYYDGQNFLERWGGSNIVRAKPLALIWRGIRSHAEPARVEAALARLGASLVRLHPEAKMSRFHLAPHEQAVIDVVRAKAQPLNLLIASRIADPNLVKRLLYTLAITRHLDLGVPGTLPVGTDEPPSSSRIPIVDKLSGQQRRRRFKTGVRDNLDQAKPPSSRRNPPADDGDGLRQEIVERDAAMASQTYYEILGVPQDASVGDIQGGFFRLAKKLHPDRLPGELEDLREVATRAFTRINEAHQTLADPARRKQYDDLLSQGGGTAEEQEKVAAVLRAAAAFQRAEVMLKKRQLEQAELEAKRAVDDDPEQADYIALYVWLQAQKPDRAESQRYDDLIEELDKCAKQEPDNERVRWYRGQLLKRAGDMRRAVRDFKWVADHNPRNLDAVRELRLHQMRKGSLSSEPPNRQSNAPGGRPSNPAGKAAGPPKQGLFGKLFKR